jgi:hypothetical protein
VGTYFSVFFISLVVSFPLCMCLYLLYFCIWKRHSKIKNSVQIIYKLINLDSSASL